ncbi:MAG: prepilin-type N-terminal cleavage/methylation domain-containing protein [Nitrospinae bacterium]|nr:prepilin-type N-terminal cleavage/methylation domain-containing protein [Nitrospinota bacterium]
MIRRRDGFTLIEMIGVLAVISILAAMVVPKIFDVIADSKATKTAAEVQVYQTAVTKWYKDIGSLQSLVAAGTVSTPDAAFQTALSTNGGTTTTTGLWAKWKGPYIDALSSASVGTSVNINTAAGTATVANNDATGWDLNSNGTAETTTSNQVVALVFGGVAASDFDRVESILDSGDSALTTAQKQARGKVKSDGAGAMYIYLAHN